MRFGRFEGKEEFSDGNKDHILGVIETWKHDPHHKFPVDCEDTEMGESAACVAARSTAGLHEVLKEHPDAKHIAIVAHNRLNKTLMGVLLHDCVYQGQHIEQGNTCVNVIDLVYGDAESENFIPEANWNPVMLNYVEHAKEE